jgi:TolB-like protein/class 3 adenylate cyclase/Tfp pilus assembly protein PilF
MDETRKLVAILAADVVGFARLAGADEEGTLARLRALRRDLVDPIVAARHGRVVKRTGDGAIVEFGSVVDAVRCAVEIQQGMAARDAGLPDEKRIIFRMGIHVGDVVEEADGDLMGDGVNVAARLEGVAKPGMICLSEQAYWQVKGRLTLKVTDLGATKLKNIGEPIHVYSLEVGQPVEAKPAPTPMPEKSAPPRLSLVVLPFANIGGAPGQEHFVDGVTESLTTDLSRMRGAFVIGRNTAFTYKGKAVDLRQIGRELNVRYVLEGSVQRGGNRMRVNVQLIDAETGNHLWAERFDKTFADFFDMQDEIVARLAGALNAQLIAAEALRAEQAQNPDSMDLYFQGLAWVNGGISPDNMARAQNYFDRALSLDPKNVETLVRSAYVDAVRGANSFVTDRAAAFAAAKAKLTKALSSIPDHARGHMVLGFVDIVTKLAAQGIAECEHALALDQNLAHAHSLVGFGKICIGRAEDTEAHVVEALRLSPRDTTAHIWMTIAGTAKNRLGSWEQAVAWLRRAIEANRNYPHPNFEMGASLAQLGRLDEAHSAVKAGLALNPAFTLSQARALLTAASDDPTYLAQLEPIFDGLRKAGLPEE